MKKIYFLFASALFLLSNAQTQKEHLSGFSMVSLTYKINKNWMLYTELQERSIEDFSNPDYYEIKGGAGYNLNKDNQAFIGLGRYANYTNNTISKEEFRLWLQYTYSLAIQKLKIDQRVRAEKRFFHNPTNGANTDDERYRYRITATYPLNRDRLEAKALYANAYEEVFIGPRDNLIKRNRVFAGIGYVFNDFLSTNIGYLWQRELSPSTKNLHFIYLGFNFIINSENKVADHMNVAD